MHQIIFFFLFCFFFSCSIPEDHNNDSSRIVILSDQIKKDPFNTSLLLERANYNIKRKNLESAIFDLKQCVSIDSVNFDFRYILSKLYFDLSKELHANSKYPELSRIHIIQALNINNTDYKANSLYGELLLSYAKYKEAVKYFNISLDNNYNQERIHMLLGYAYKKLNREEDAISCFENAINVNPEFKEAYIQLGHVFHLRKDTLALIYYNNALSVDSNDQIALYNKAVFYQETLNWNKALESYAQLHKINAFHANGHYNLGFIHMELGLYDIAANNFSDAIYSNSMFFEAYYSRGVCFETLGNILQAESDYKKAIEINPKYTFALDALSEFNKRNKKYQ